jgi:hypothetical protein
MSDFDLRRDKLTDRNYKGEDYQPNKKMTEGALKERRCTDVLCLVVFITYLGFMGWMTH